MYMARASNISNCQNDQTTDVGRASFSSDGVNRLDLLFTLCFDFNVFIDAQKFTELALLVSSLAI